MMILDIVSHWVGMYSKLLTQESHKHYNQDENFLLRFYYTFPYALFCLCVGNETFLLATYLQAFMYVDIVESIDAGIELSCAGQTMSL